MVIWLRRLWPAALLALAAGAAAQPGAPGVAQLEPSAELRCLQPPADARSDVAYPFWEKKEGRAGRVKVRLHFEGPTRSPLVQVLEQEGDDAFVDAVQRAVRAWRVPCHDGGEAAARFVFEFHFRPDQPVASVDAADADAAERGALLACIVHTSGEKRPEYPRAALEREVQGRLIALLRFHAPDQPPEVLLQHSGGDVERLHALDAKQPLVKTVRDWSAGYRMPCLTGRPMRVSYTFVFRIEGSEFGFKKEFGLREFLPMVRNIQLQRLDFDFTTMKCPFEVALHYRQPGLPNIVQQIGAVEPARRPFIDWLRQSRLDLPPRFHEAVFGDTATILIPCARLNLNP